MSTLNSQLPLALTVGTKEIAHVMTFQKTSERHRFGADLDGKDMFRDSRLNSDT